MCEIEPILKISNLGQIGMIVANLKESMEALWCTFGIGPWEVFLYEPDALKEVTYYGKPSSSGLKVALAQVGKIQFELIEPIGTDNIYQDYLRKYGSGIQHLGLHVVATLEEFQKAKQTLEEKGFPCMFTLRTYRGAYAYFDTIKVLN